ncbi:MAG TPA: diphthine--ammonia ligase [Alphaproteobacteria bacterium]|nr:diphthine--ammonia ligase [Alphaproteobacteria bacterium]
MKEKIIFCWSGGKDSALALNRILREGRYEVVSLLTTCNEHFQRVSMHGVRVELLERQAQSIGLPLEKVFVSQRSSNEEYQEKMSACLSAHKARGVTACAFGDIFLEDLKRWREENLARIGMRGIFPIWKTDSRELIREFFALGFGTVVCCVNDAWLDAAFVGRNINDEFIRSLPANVDPCGENGEFHSFAFAGPIFKEPVKFKVGEKVYRPVEVTPPADAADSNSSYVCPTAGPTKTRGFWFCDLLPE